jgi:REP element-mobilizing transposase RayT
MSTYTQILYQIVFSTCNRKPVLTQPGRDRLFKFIWGLLKNKKCHLYRINGVLDHIHILTHLHPSVALSQLVKDIKLGSHDLIHKEQLFPDFDGWQEGYGAFTYSFREKDQLIDYVKNQETHHQKHSFQEEYIDLLDHHSIEYDPKYLP